MQTIGSPDQDNQAPVAKSPFIDLSKLITDSHLTKEEKLIISESYEADKKALLDATKGEIRDFILKDYGAANHEALGGTEGVKSLQRALGVKEDGHFGPDTFKALIEYQKANELETDAIAGPKTQEKLGVSKVAENTGVSAGKQANKIGKPSVQTGKMPELNRTPAVQAETASFAPSIRKFSSLVGGVESQIKEINESKQANTGVVGGIGDWVGEKTGAYETGKQIYERQMKYAQEQTKSLHSQIVSEFSGKKLTPSEMAEVDVLISRLEKASGAKLQEVSWGKAVFNSIGAEDIQGDTGSMKNRAKIFAKTTVGLAEGAYDTISSIAEITGKAIGILAAYTFESETRVLIEQDIADIFSKLTIENAKKAIAMLPGALEKFANATPDVQAEGFGKFFGGLLVAGGIGVKVLQGGKHATKLGYRAVRMASHKGLSSAAPLAIAGVTQISTGAAAIGTGAAIRVGEMDVIPGKKIPNGKFEKVHFTGGRHFSPVDTHQDEFFKTMIDGDARELLAKDADRLAELRDRFAQTKALLEGGKIKNIALEAGEEDFKLMFRKEKEDWAVYAKLLEVKGHTPAEIEDIGLLLMGPEHYLHAIDSPLIQDVRFVGIDAGKVTHKRAMDLIGEIESSRNELIRLGSKERKIDISTFNKLQEIQDKILNAKEFPLDDDLKAIYRGIKDADATKVAKDWIESTKSFVRNAERRDRVMAQKLSKLDGETIMSTGSQHGYVAEHANQTNSWRKKVLAMNNDEFIDMVRKTSYYTERLTDDVIIQLKKHIEGSELMPLSEFKKIMKSLDYSGNDVLSKLFGKTELLTNIRNRYIYKDGFGREVHLLYKEGLSGRPIVFVDGIEYEVTSEIRYRDGGSFDLYCKPKDGGGEIVIKKMVSRKDIIIASPEVKSEVDKLHRIRGAHTFEKNGEILRISKIKKGLDENFEKFLEKPELMFEDRDFIGGTFELLFRRASRSQGFLDPDRFYLGDNFGDKFFQILNKHLKLTDEQQLRHLSQVRSGKDVTGISFEIRDVQNRIMDRGTLHMDGSFVLDSVIKKVA